MALLPNKRVASPAANHKRYWVANLCAIELASALLGLLSG